MLNVHNSYVKDFKSALEMMPTDDYKLVIRADKTPTRQHERHYNAPTVNEMAIVIVGNDFNRRDVILHKRNTHLQRLSETHRSYRVIIKFYVLGIFRVGCNSCTKNIISSENILMLKRGLNHYICHDLRVYDII